MNKTVKCIWPGRWSSRCQNKEQHLVKNNLGFYNTKSEPEDIRIMNLSNQRCSSDRSGALSPLEVQNPPLESAFPVRPPKGLASLPCIRNSQVTSHTLHLWLSLHLLHCGCLKKQEKQQEWEGWPRDLPGFMLRSISAALFISQSLTPASLKMKNRDQPDNPSFFPWESTNINYPLFHSPLKNTHMSFK